MANLLNATEVNAAKLKATVAHAAGFATRALNPTVLVPTRYIGGTAKVFATGKVVASLGSTRLQLTFLNARRSGTLPTPLTTMTTTITVTDQNGNTVSNLSVASLVVTFPDGTLSSAMTLANGGITNLGAGQYQAKYNTKLAGVMLETWTVTAADGTTIAQFQFEVGVGY